MEYYIDKIHLSVNDPYRPRYHQIIDKHQSAGRKYFDGLNKSMSIEMIYVFENINDCNPKTL